MKYVIVGNGIQATLVRKYVEESELVKIDAFVVDEEFIKKEYISNCRVISFEELYKLYPSDSCRLFMGIGYKSMGNLRQRLYEMLKDRGYIFENYIHPTCVLPKDIMIGEGNIILESVIIEQRCKIGNANLLFGGVIVGHDSEIDNYVTMSINSSCMGEVHIKNNCFMGGGSTVRNQVTLNDHVLVSAAAHVYKDVPAYCVVRAPKSNIDSSINSLELL